MLTTMTTVLGLAPLLFERSQQAQFLKPTVITLVYGLGFGLVLVLLVVPALIAVQRDVARPMTAMRRAVAGSHRGMRWLVGVTGVLLLGWMGATLGWAVVTGGLPERVLSLVPQLADMGAMRAGLVLFVSGALGIVLVVYLLAVMVGGRLAARRV